MRAFTPSITGRTAAAALAAFLITAVPAGAAPPDGDGWTKLDGRVRPFGALAAAMAYDEARREMVLFPGYDDRGGPSGTWVRRAGVWTRVATSVEPEPRYGGMMVYDAAREEAVLFGGYGSNPGGGPSLALADTWTWDGETWTRHRPPTSPNPRAFAAMAYDRIRQEVVLFGGIGVNDQGQAYSHLGDTWTWNGEAWTKQQPAASPSPRNSPGAAFDEARGEVVLFGGDGAGSPNQCTARPMNICVDLDNEGGDPGELNDTWAWNGQTWSQRPTTNAPEERSSMGMAYDPVRERVVLFSGVSIGGLFWDTWAFDGTDWTEVTPDLQPGARFSPSMAFDAELGEMVLWGGHRITYLASDTWGWDGTSWASLEEPTPLERLDEAMAYDPTTGAALLFGGLGDQVYGDTWVYEEGWRQLTPATSPSARFDAAVANDVARDEVVLFGGTNSSYDELADTWIWDGAGWVDRTPSLPSLSPPARQGSAMAYDGARGETVLFGGWNTDLPITAVLSDTWTWDGAEWSLEPAIPGPPALRDHMMAYDAKRGEIVLYGGIDDNNEVAGETWTWDGDGWTEEQPAQTPGPRASSSMMYDPTTERVLLFGGLGSERPPKVWAWDGSTWTGLAIPGGPSRAGYSETTFAPAMQGHLVYGAGEGSGDETWLLRVPPTGGAGS